MKRRILSILLIFCLGLSVLSQGVVTAAAAEVSSTAEDTKFSGGSGLKADPYRISSPEDLLELADEINSFSWMDYLGTYFEMTTDIDLSGICGPDIEGKEVSWTPIGNGKSSTVHRFAGNFDGGGFKITGLYINSEEDYQGLFGYLADTLEASGGNTGIQNLTVEGTVTGGTYVGGIAGCILDQHESCTIKNCYSNVTVTGTKYVGGIIGYAEDPVKFLIENCHNGGSVTGDGYVGGITGYVAGTMEGCHNEGAVTGSHRVGGIAGWGHASLRNNYNTGTVTGDEDTGGIMGYSGRSVENCYNTGTVTGDEEAGGIVGYSGSSVENCYNTGAVTGTSYVGKIAGKSTDDKISNCYYPGDASGAGDGGIGVENKSTGNDVAGQAVAKSMDEFASGEVAWLLQNGQDNQDELVWGQQLGGALKEPYPDLMYFTEEEDEETRKAKRVLKVAFHTTSDEGEGDTAYLVKYMNWGSAVKLPEDPELPEGMSPDEYGIVWMESGDGTGEIFQDGTKITEDTDLYAFSKARFTGKETPIVVIHGNKKEYDLDQCMQYAGDTEIDVTDNFTYEILSGNDLLNAERVNSTLIIPDTAARGIYTLTIRATETEMKGLMPLVRSAADNDGIKSTTFVVKVFIVGTNEEHVEAAQYVAEAVLDAMPVTNDTSKEDIEETIRAALEKAGCKDITITMQNDFDKITATADREGKITGTVTVSKGEISADVAIDKVIKNDDLCVAAAKEVVENILKTIMGTNDITKDHIQSTINAALKEAGYEDVTVTIDGFSIEKATKEAEGSITGTVTIAKGEASDSISMVIPIAKLPQDGTDDQPGSPDNPDTTGNPGTKDPSATDPDTTDNPDKGNSDGGTGDKDTNSTGIGVGEKATAGSGASKAVYEAAGKNTVTYLKTKVKKSAGKATVPAAVKIKGQKFKVTKIAKSAFKGYKKLKAVTVKAEGLTKKKVKGCFKGTSVKTVKVPKKLYKKYKKIFTKKITGSKVKVKVKKLK